ncbi:hypothetical protein ABMA27_003349 [Loxostege sticticalis]|uniref:Uncharacterized protein n=1 Tax=Loxostege sticticalis TaxID=481309 RepID=A0ABR3HT08_LOXSC
MAALDFYAGGSYQRRVGKDFNLGLCQTAVQKCVAEVTDALNNPAILLRHIAFPSNSEERLAVMRVDINHLILQIHGCLWLPRCCGLY